jgi:small nuclear ribonucleoprotein (snRNP)-like protein
MNLVLDDAEELNIKKKVCAIITLTLEHQHYKH